MKKDLERLMRDTGIDVLWVSGAASECPDIYYLTNGASLSKAWVILRIGEKPLLCHSPMERECLEVLLRGEQPVILCAARRLMGLRIGQTARQAVDEGRMLVLSPFGKNIRRTTAAQAVLRNDLVAALVDAVWVPHAVPEGKTWAIVLASLARGQPVFTFDEEENSEILQAGAQPFDELLKSA